MRGISMIGVLLVVLGVAALAIGQFSYTDTKPVLKAGPIQVNSTEEHRVNVPLIGGIVILVAGVALIVIGRRPA
ncbi:MAG TPA: hypothetical protein VGF97_02675 [Rhizomicrobium sp.]|jgi:uncharacterized membrane protein